MSGKAVQRTLLNSRYVLKRWEQVAFDGEQLPSIRCRSLDVEPKATLVSAEPQGHKRQTNTM